MTNRVKKEIKNIFFKLVSKNSKLNIVSVDTITGKFEFLWHVITDKTGLRHVAY